MGRGSVRGLGPGGLLPPAGLLLAACSLMLPGGPCEGADPEPDAGCGLSPEGLPRALLDNAGCPWLDDEDLIHARIDEECRLDTDACDIDCLLGAERAGRCVVEGLLGEGETCVIVVASLFVEEDLDVRGSAPAVILSRGPIVVDDHLNAAASVGGPGPGGSAGGEAGAPGEGQAGGEAGLAAGEARGGGGGGGLLGPGGAGGCAGGGAGGGEVSVCAGELPAGGSGGGGSASCAGGHGGGAIWLFSREAIEVRSEGLVDLDGSSGDREDDEPTGGGGGGSGGSVLLEAPLVVLDGRVEARGGGGGDVRAADAWSGRGEGATETIEGGEGACVETAGGGGGGGSGAVLVRAARLLDRRRRQPLEALCPFSPLSSSCP